MLNAGCMRPDIERNYSRSDCDLCAPLLLFAP